MRDKWSDERLDDLNRGVVDGFNRVDADLREIRAETGTGIGSLRGEMNGLRGEMNGLRGEMNARFEHVDECFGRVDARFEHVEARFDALQRTMLQLGGGMIVALIGLVATQL